MKKIENDKTAYVKEILANSIEITGSFAEDFLRIKHGIKLENVPRSDNLRYIKDCPYFNIENKAYKALIGIKRDKYSRVSGLLLYNLNAKSEFNISLGNRSGTILIGERTAQTIIFAKDLITALKLSNKTRLTACAFLSNENIYGFLPTFSSIKSMELHLESRIAFEQIRVGSKSHEYWKSIGVDVAFRQLDKASIRQIENNNSANQIQENQSNPNFLDCNKKRKINGKQLLRRCTAYSERSFGDIQNPRFHPQYDALAQGV